MSTRREFSKGRLECVRTGDDGARGTWAGAVGRAAGLSGLTTACLLRRKRSVLFELRQRFSVLPDESWRTYAELLAPRLANMLALLKVDPGAVRQVRTTRWGHAMPLSRPGLIANGTTDELLRPFQERVFFVNQDNWALPAVENSLLDADRVAREIRALLR